MTEEQEHFLKEYKILCEKYHKVVDACGCCNGPWVVDDQDNKYIQRHVDHLTLDLS